MLLRENSGRHTATDITIDRLRTSIKCRNLGRVGLSGEHVWVTAMHEIHDHKILVYRDTDEFAINQRLHNHEVGEGPCNGPRKKSGPTQTEGELKENRIPH